MQAENNPPGAPRRYRARFVRAGRIQAAGGEAGGVEVTPQALAGAVQAGLFEKRAVFLDHARLWENASLEKIVGVAGQAAFDGSAVSGEIEMYDTPLARAVSGLLDELLEQGPNAPDVGLSLVFYPIWGAAYEGGGQITGIRHIESIDLVFQPAADGRILAALSAGSQPGAAGAASGETRNPRRAFDRLAASEALALSPAIQAANLSISSKPQKETPMPEIPVTAPETQATPEPQPTPDWLTAISTAGAQAMIAASGLPAVSRQRLLSAQYQDPIEVQDAIDMERAYLAALAQDQVVQLSGQPPRSPQITGVRTDLDRISMALDALIAGVRTPDGVQPLTGIREAYHLLSGDFEMSGLFHPDRVQFANVNSSTMAALVANALNKRLINEFQQYPQWWAPFASIEDFTNLQDVRWITLGGVGELPTVAEGAAYTELTWDDKTETASFVKKGGYLGITLEAIDKDDIGRIRAAPRALAQAAWLTLSKAVSYIFTQESGTGPLVSDSTRLFTSGHGNLGSSALTATTYQAARLAMRKQTELNSGERLGALTAPKFLLVPPDLEITALQILASEHDYLYTLSNGQAAPVNALTEGDTLNARMNFARNRVIVVDLWTDTNDWACVADPMLYPSIGLGFRYGRTPEIFSVASPTAGLMFTNDTMPIKARFFFAVGPTDWKGLYKANVT